MKTLLLLFVFIVTGSNASDINSLIGNAGCLVKHNDKVLLVTQNSGKFSIPGGLANSNETAVQTAIRETYEETQIVVEATSLLKQFSNGFYIFACKIKKYPKELKPTVLYLFEIRDVGFYDISRLKKEELRYPSQYELYLQFQKKD